jgi:hypothetical protein
MAQVNEYGGRTVSLTGACQGVIITEDAVDDSDKTITLPTGGVYYIENIFITYTASADAGNRQVAVVVANGGVTLGIFNAVAVIIANAVEYLNFSPHYGTASESPATMHYCPLPVNVIEGGATIRIYDSAAIAAAADHMIVAITAVRF